MNRGFRLLSVMLLAGFCLTLVADDASARVRRSVRGPTEVLVEAGAVMPRGDLEASFDTPAGTQAGIGWEAGVRVRQHLNNGWAIAPSFHFADYEDHFLAGETFDTVVKTATLSYGVDVQHFLQGPRHGPRFYVTAGASLVRNKLREEYSDDTYFADGVNSVATRAGVGLRAGDWEVLAQYQRNRFDTERFYDASEYNWDSISLRVGIALPHSY